MIAGAVVLLGGKGGATGLVTVDFAGAPGPPALLAVSSTSSGWFTSSAVGTYYFPIAQNTDNGLTFALKTSGDPHALASAVRGALRRIDPELPVFDAQTMEERVAKSLVSRRSPVVLSLTFGSSCRRSASTACSRIS